MSDPLMFPDPVRTALLLVDLQNDFIHPDGAYARGGATSTMIAALPAKLVPLAESIRVKGGWLVSTHFTLVPGKAGEPFISPHLAQVRPFLRRGDFVPGSWGHDVLEALPPIDMKVEKVAFSAFYMSRLEWVLRKAEIDTLIIGGIVTNGGVASTAPTQSSSTRTSGWASRLTARSSTCAMTSIWCASCAPTRATCARRSTSASRPTATGAWR